MTANESGNLMTRDINTIIKEYNKEKSPHAQFKPVETRLQEEAPEIIQMMNDFNSSSSQKLQPVLTTLYVVVPKNDQKNWKTNYENLFLEDEEKKRRGRSEKRVF